MLVRTSTFLAVDRGQTQWAVHARIVHNIVSHHEWTGNHPFDIADALGLVTNDEDVERPVLLLASDGAALPFRAFGKLSFRQLDMSQVQPIPAIVRNPGKKQIVSAVIFEESGPPLVVLDPVMLLSMAREAFAE
jgi:hypothetical protein